jgi:hypothetical protein
MIFPNIGQLVTIRVIDNDIVLPQYHCRGIFQPNEEVDNYNIYRDYNTIHYKTHTRPLVAKILAIDTVNQVAILSRIGMSKIDELTHLTKLHCDHVTTFSERETDSLAVQPVIVRVTFELRCFSIEGIDAIKLALTKGQTFLGNNCKINLISTGEYVISLMAQNEYCGKLHLYQSLIEIAIIITEHGGDITLLDYPYIVKNHDMNYPTIITTEKIVELFGGNKQIFIKYEGQPYRLLSSDSND